MFNPVFQSWNSEKGETIVVESTYQIGERYCLHEEPLGIKVKYAGGALVIGSYVHV
jgi:hypothetical protein